MRPIRFLIILLDRTTHLVLKALIFGYNFDERKFGDSMKSSGIVIARTIYKLDSDTYMGSPVI